MVGRRSKSSERPADRRRRHCASNRRLEVCTIAPHDQISRNAFASGSLNRELTACLRSRNLRPDRNVWPTFAQENLAGGTDIPVCAILSQQPANARRLMGQSGTAQTLNWLS